MSEQRVQPMRSERSVVAYLAFLGILLAFGIDASLPAFDELRDAFGLEEGSNRITLVVTVYFLGMAVGQLFYGPLADRFGRMRAVQLGVALYSLGAVGAIVAPSFAVLLLSRTIWGLGAAAGASLRSTIARDLYEGDQMARVVSLMMAVFMLGPVFAPLVGEAILSVGSWRWVFGAALVLAAVQFVWTARFGETLDPAHQRPFEVRSVMAGIATTLRHPVARGYTLVAMFSWGSFMVFLGSSQPIIDEIYEREDEFALWFGLAGIVMALAFLVSASVIDRLGGRRVGVVVAGAALSLTSVFVLVCLVGDGTPPFLVWFVLIALINAFTTVLSPICFSLGLLPMGELAGTASAVMGFVATAGGALLAAFIDASIDTTVTPMAVGMVVFLAAALALLLRIDDDSEVSEDVGSASSMR